MAQRAGVGTQSNGGKEVQQQRIARFQIETDRDPHPVVQDEDNQGASQAAHQGFRDAVSTQDARTRYQALANEQQQNGERESMVPSSLKLYGGFLRLQQITTMPSKSVLVKTRNSGWKLSIRWFMASG